MAVEELLNQPVNGASCPDALGPGAQVGQVTTVDWRGHAHWSLLMLRSTVDTSKFQHAPRSMGQRNARRHTLRFSRVERGFTLR